MLPMAVACGAHGCDAEGHRQRWGGVKVGLAFLASVPRLLELLEPPRFALLAFWDSALVNSFPALPFLFRGKALQCSPGWPATQRWAHTLSPAEFASTAAIS